MTKRVSVDLCATAILAVLRNPEHG